LRFRKLLDDESGQILKRIIVFGVVFAFIILVVVEVGPLIWERFDVAQVSEDMASAAANNYRIYRNEAEAVAEVTNKLQLAGYSPEEISQCSVYFLPSSGPKMSVKVVIVRYANTLLTKNIKALHKFAKITATHEVGLTQATQ
jgi:hypothetical protein